MTHGVQTERAGLCPRASRGEARRRELAVALHCGCGVEGRVCGIQTRPARLVSSTRPTRTLPRSSPNTRARRRTSGVGRGPSHPILHHTRTHDVLCVHHKSVSNPTEPSSSCCRPRQLRVWLMDLSADVDWRETLHSTSLARWASAPGGSRGSACVGAQRCCHCPANAPSPLTRASLRSCERAAESLSTARRQ